jgi:hypothetical protein
MNWTGKLISFVVALSCHHRFIGISCYNKSRALNVQYHPIDHGMNNSLLNNHENMEMEHSNNTHTLVSGNGNTSTVVKVKI